METSSALPCDRPEAGWAPSECGLVNDLWQAQPQARRLLGRSEKERETLGYLHTLREILQQPATWLETCERAVAHTSQLRQAAQGIQALVLTGSGSSEYAAGCVRPALQKELAAVTLTMGGGELLTDLPAVLPPQRPALMVSLARSGNSPESLGALRAVREREPGIRQLVVTCNRDGGLALACARDSSVPVLALDERTNDRSLVMTSSFSNLVVAARYLGMLATPDRYRRICRQMSAMCRALFINSFDALAEVAERAFNRVVFLGSGAGLGAASESALKMLEMTAGRVAAMRESYLGFRHGPMSFAEEKTLVVCYLSSDPLRRDYELDLVRELHRKRLGLAIVMVGDGIPKDLLREQDVAVELPGLSEIGDDQAPVLYVAVGQLLAFSRCLSQGLQPDSPSQNGIINRVVESFPLYPTERT